MLLLIEGALKRGERVAIAIREVPVGKGAPHTYKAIKKMLLKRFHSWRDMIEVHQIPDFAVIYCLRQEVAWLD
jgi:hypothetical protein